MKRNETKTARSLIAAAAIILGTFLTGAVSAEENTGRAYDEIEFTEGAPGVHFGLLWGDWNTGPFSMIVRIEGGAKAPDHHHTANYNAVSIQGNWVHTTLDGVDHVITPGSYAHQPALENHGDRCRGPEDCIILVQMDGPNAFIVAE
jgi:hypothetical protein